MSSDLAALQEEFLFFGLERIDREKPVWHSTGKLLRKHRPEVYRLAVELLGRGRHGKRELCELLHVSPHTLEAIEADQAENLATLRQRAARENMELHRMCLERASELIPRCDDLGKVAISSGIFAEKSQLFAGEATARIVRGEPVDLISRFAAFCQELEANVAAREKVADVQEIVAPGKEKATNGIPPALPGLPSIRPDGAGWMAETDCISDASASLKEGQANKQANNPSATTADPADPADETRAAAAAADRGGGGRADAGPGRSSNR